MVAKALARTGQRYIQMNIWWQKNVLHYKHTRRHSIVEILGRTAQKYNVAFGGRNTGSVSPIWRAPPNASLMRTACSSPQQHSCKGPVEYLYVSSNFALQKLSYSITPASLIPCTAFIILIRLQFTSIYNQHHIELFCTQHLQPHFEASCSRAQ